MQTPEVPALLAKQSATAHTESRAEFTAFIKAEREPIARVSGQVGITPDWNCGLPKESTGMFRRLDKSCGALEY